MEKILCMKSEEKNKPNINPNKQNIFSGKISYSCIIKGKYPLELKSLLPLPSSITKSFSEPRLASAPFTIKYKIFPPEQNEIAYGKHIHIHKHKCANTYTDNNTKRPHCKPIEKHIAIMLNGRMRENSMKCIGTKRTTNEKVAGAKSKVIEKHVEVK